MSLLVNIYVRDPHTGQVQVLPSENHEAELAVGEQCRHDLWGSDAAQSLGLTLLPQLAEQDMYAEGDDLPRLEQEAQTVLQNVESLAQATGYGAAYIGCRAENLLAAVRCASALEAAGVVLW